MASADKVRIFFIFFPLEELKRKTHFEMITRFLTGWLYENCWKFVSVENNCLKVKRFIYGDTIANMGGCYKS